MATPLASWSQVRGFKAIYPPRPVLRLYPSTATQDGPHLVEDDEYEDIGSAVNVPVESNNWPSTVSAAGMLYMNWLHACNYFCCDCFLFFFITHSLFCITFFGSLLFLLVTRIIFFSATFFLAHFSLHTLTIRSFRNN